MDQFLLSVFEVFCTFQIWQILRSLGGNTGRKVIQSVERGIIFQLRRERKLFLKMFLTEMCLKFLGYHIPPILVTTSGISLSAI